MRSREVLELAVRIMAMWTLISGIAALGNSFAEVDTIRRSLEQTRNAVSAEQWTWRVIDAFLGPTTQVAVGQTLWVFSSSIAALAYGRQQNGSSVPLVTLSVREATGISLQLVGCYSLLRSVDPLSRLLECFYLGSGRPLFVAGDFARLIEAFFYVVGGILLLVGVRLNSVRTDWYER